MNSPDVDGEDNVHFFWITAVTTDGEIVVANSYGLGYIPDAVQLPKNAHMATADQAIAAVERARWTAYPVAALQGWAAHHKTELRAVIATAEQLANSDPGTAKVVLEQSDVPDSGVMIGRSRFEVVNAEAATRLAQAEDSSLMDVLPPAPVQLEPPEDLRLILWLPLMMTTASDAAGREDAHLRAFHAYAAHAEEIALYEARITTSLEDRRNAIEDWLYWKHLAQLHAEAIGVVASVGGS